MPTIKLPFCVAPENAERLAAGLCDLLLDYFLDEKPSTADWLKVVSAVLNGADDKNPPVIFEAWSYSKFEKQRVLRLRNSVLGRISLCCSEEHVIWLVIEISVHHQGAHACAKEVIKCWHRQQLELLRAWAKIQTAALE